MLYYLFDWLDKAFDFPGAGVFQYISFRASMSAITSLLIMLFCGKPFIRFIRRKSIGETVRNLGLEGQKEKEGTPTMGGLLILSAIIIACAEELHLILPSITILTASLISTSKASRCSFASRCCEEVFRQSVAKNKCIVPVSFDDDSIVGPK